MSGKAHPGHAIPAHAHQGFTNLLEEIRLILRPHQDQIASTDGPQGAVCPPQFDLRPFALRDISAKNGNSEHLALAFETIESQLQDMGAGGCRVLRAEGTFGNSPLIETTPQTAIIFISE